MFKCDNGQEIPMRWRCTGEPSCDDGSDERNCEGTPTYTSSAYNELESATILQPSSATQQADDSDEESTMFKCDNGKEIPMRWRCTGEPACNDGSDERNCEGTTTYTSSAYPDHESATILQPSSATQQADDSDEEYRTPTSQPMFKCDNGQLVPMILRCNGDTACRDGSDEIGCGGETIATSSAYPDLESTTILQPSSTTQQQTVGMVQGECENDCSNKSTTDKVTTEVTTTEPEVPTPPEPTTENENKSTTHLDSTIVWNTTTENSAPEPTKGKDDILASGNSNMFQCGSGEEIPIEWRCSRIQSCLDGSDEK